MSLIRRFPRHATADVDADADTDADTDADGGDRRGGCEDKWGFSWACVECVGEGGALAGWVSRSNGRPPRVAAITPRPRPVIAAVPPPPPENPPTTPTRPVAVPALLLLLLLLLPLLRGSPTLILGGNGEACGLGRGRGNRIKGNDGERDDGNGGSAPLPPSGPRAMPCSPTALAPGPQASERGKRPSRAMFPTPTSKATPFPGVGVCLGVGVEAEGADQPNAGRSSGGGGNARDST